MVLEKNKLFGAKKIDTKKEMAHFLLLFLSACAFTETACWTIDLPEVRQYYFDKYAKHNDLVKRNITLDKDEYLFSNYYSDSKHHENNKGYVDYEHGPYSAYKEDIADMEDTFGLIYAEEYEHQSYMEKKVTGIVHNGSKYLEGLRRSLERYYDTLENCTRMNFTETGQNMTSSFQGQGQNTTSFSGLGQNMTSFSGLGQNMASFLGLGQNMTSSGQTTNSSYSYEKCTNATRKSEHIRRVAQLALHTTRMLQDRVYSNKYNEEEEYDLEDKTLILRLALFLDKLALLTGYEPNIDDVHTTTTESPSTPEVTIPTLVQVPEDVKNAMMECLHKKGNSSEPATVRCNFPVTYTEFMNQIFNAANFTVPQTDPNSPSQNIVKRNAEDITLGQEMLQQEEPQYIEKPVAASKSIKKRSLPDDNPLHNIINYYAKYKAWANVNPETANDEVFKEKLHDKNDLGAKPKKRIARDITSKDVSSKSKEQVSKNRFEFQPNIIRDNKSVKKRSLYYRKKVRPSIPEDPMQDISYYVKNKKGTEYNANPAQAALVRASLEAAFQNGNIEEIRRYGSNQNPLVFAHVYQGLAQSAGDLV